MSDFRVIAPEPGLVTAARAHLSQRFARGVQEVLWEGRGMPMPDQDAIAHVIKAAAAGESLSAEDLAAALLLTQAVRLDIDLMEADLMDIACNAGMSWEQIATVLDLPDAGTARRRYDQLKDRLSARPARTGGQADLGGPIDARKSPHRPGGSTD